MTVIIFLIVATPLLIWLLVLQAEHINKNIEPMNQPEKGVDSDGKEIAKSPKQKAIDWAISIGYPVPTKLDGCLAAILVVVGLLMFVVPGVLLLVWIWVQNNQYERDIKALIEKWVDAGRPEPGEGIKEVTKLERIVETVEPSQGSTEQRLQELESLKEKGLITDEEYQAMRKKALGL